VKYNKNYYFYLFIYTFFSLISLQVRPVDGFFTRDSSKDVKSRVDVPFWDLNDVPLNFGGKTTRRNGQIHII